MDSAVRSRPTYYELLGLAPRATGRTIAEAFAKATNVLQPHAFGGMAEICLAYQTLSDPIRRRAYDASIGLKPEPPRMPTPRPISAHFMALPAVGGPLVEPLVEPRPTAPKVEAKPAEPVIDPPPVIFDTPPPQLAPARLAYDEVDVGFGSIDWRRTGIVLGGLVAAAVLIGALAGWWSGSSAAEPQTKRSASVRHQAEEKVPTFAELWPGPAPRMAGTRPDRPRRAVVVRSGAQRPSEATRLGGSEAEAQLIQPPADLADPAPDDSLAPQPAAAPVAMAAMPLPPRTIARTLDRVGYRCGSVSSATAVEGAAGVYKVNCTSGQSYQAKPVNGRYRFRRLAGN